MKRSKFILQQIINDVEKKGQRKTVAYYIAKTEIKKQNK